MTARRHFGTIRKLPSGRYQARYLHDGHRHIAPDTFKAKADALTWLAGIETTIHGGAWVDPIAGKVTLEDFAKRWIAQRADLRPSTRGKYTHLLEGHIIPGLGSRELTNLSPAAVRSWYHELAGRYQTTADDGYRMLRAMMNTAVSDGILVRSPCTVKGAGQVRSAERPVASIAEVGAAVAALPERWRLGAMLAAWCQLRRGEVLALQRRDIDLLHKEVKVERAWSTPMNGPAVLGDPKTEAGRRTLTIPPNMLPGLKDHLDRFVGPEPSAWLFATSSGTPVSPRNFNRAWGKARAKAGRPDLHIHDLRHSGLTWSAATGASTAELMRRGGHASPRAALRYQHATEDRDRALADALGKLAKPAKVTKLGTRSGSYGHVVGTTASGRKKAPSAKGA